jgi:hypothetical protein
LARKEKMKAMLLGFAVSLWAASALAQGEVWFANRVTGNLVTHIYAPSPYDPMFHQIGNGSADTPAGTLDWSGFTLIGASGSNGQFGAATTLAQLLGAPGYNQPESSLLLAIPVTSFRTGAAAGNIFPAIATLENVDYYSPATVEMVAWDNSSGLYPTWTEASPAWASGLIAAGKSGTVNTQTATPTAAAPPLVGLQSFNLFFIPEPSGLGLAAAAGILGVLWRCKAKRRKGLLK